MDQTTALFAFGAGENQESAGRQGLVMGWEAAWLLGLRGKAGGAMAQPVGGQGLVKAAGLVTTGEPEPRGLTV